MPRALKVCTCTGCPAHDGPCPELTPRGRCPRCTRQADRGRGTARERGYDRRHERRFRKQVLDNEPWCTCTDTDCGHGSRCYAASEHADHHPLDRRELVRRGLDPNDPQHGRGLCRPCHARHTAKAQPGGWNQR